MIHTCVNYVIELLNNRLLSINSIDIYMQIFISRLSHSLHHTTYINNYRNSLFNWIYFTVMQMYCFVWKLYFYKRLEKFGNLI